VIPKAVRIFVSLEPQDMRRGFDRLARVIREELGGDPQRGLFVFVSRRRDRLKVLWWDRNGYAVLYKRLHRAKARLPRAVDASQRAVEIDVVGLDAMMRGVDNPVRRRARNRS
jgi:transposase